MRRGDLLGADPAAPGNKLPVLQSQLLCGCLICTLALLLLPCDVTLAGSASLFRNHCILNTPTVRASSNSFFRDVAEHNSICPSILSPPLPFPVLPIPPLLFSALPSPGFLHPKFPWSWFQTSGLMATVTPLPVGQMGVCAVCAAGPRIGLHLRPLPHPPTYRFRTSSTHHGYH